MTSGVNSVNDQPLAPSLFESTTSSSQTTANRVILSVDDEPLVRITREKLLQQAGYGVVSAVDGENALRLFERDAVDLVLLDYTMPGLDGGAVAHEMKRTKPGVPVVMVSGASLPAEVLAEVDCSVTKGQDPGLLLGTIRRLLAA